MKRKRIDVLKDVRDDIINGTSHSVSYLLDDDIETTLSEKGIKIRKIFAPMLRFIYRQQSSYRLKIDTDTRVSSYSGGKIFVINHRQADDIVLGANAVGESGYIVFGNKYLALETFNGLGLWAYGMILLDRDNVTSRNSTYEKMKYVIEHGGNIIIYPEGYWNLDDDGLADLRHGADAHNSESWLIQDINIGVVRLAKETGCPIIPTILHYDEYEEKRCYSKKGGLFFIGTDDDIFVKKEELLEHMQTIYYELMEKYSSYDRSELEVCGKTLREQWCELKRSLIADCDIEKIGYKLDLGNEKLIGKAKVLNPVVTNSEAFEHLDRLNYGKKNAFLLSKKWSGKY